MEHLNSLANRSIIGGAAFVMSALGERRARSKRIRLMAGVGINAMGAAALLTGSVGLPGLSI